MESIQNQQNHLTNFFNLFIIGQRGVFESTHSNTDKYTKTFIYIYIGEQEQTKLIYN